jgi:hypothetical protein
MVTYPVMLLIMLPAVPVMLLVMLPVMLPAVPVMLLPIPVMLANTPVPIIGTSNMLKANVIANDKIKILAIFMRNNVALLKYFLELSL